MRLALPLLFLASVAFAQAPEGQFTVNTQGLAVTMSAKAGWTITSLDFDGNRLLVPAGSQGAVYQAPGGEWFGSTMKGGETPLLLAVSVDGRTLEGDLPETIAGESVTVRKASIIDKVAHVATTTFEKDTMVQRHYFRVLQEVSANPFYAFAYSVTPDMDQWVAQPLQGQLMEGAFSSSAANFVSQSIRWGAEFDLEKGAGLVVYFPEATSGAGSDTRFWDQPAYRKLLMQPTSGKLEAGTEISSLMVLRPFMAGADNWKDVAGQIAGELQARFPPKEVAENVGRLYGEGVPEDGFITAKTRDYTIQFSAKQAWTIYNFTYRDHLIGHSNGFYGTVLIPVGGNFIGTGHTEGGREIVHAVKLLVDGLETPVEIGKVYTGSRIELIKDSTIHKFKARATITVTDDEVIERQELEALETFDLKIMYLFMHCWQGTTSKWLAELPDGETIGGDFNNEGNEVLKDTRWVAQYEPNMGIGILGYTPKVASGNGSHTMIWNLERYHKFYTRRVGLPETFEAGQKLDYTMIVRGVPDESGDWEATRAAAEDLKRRYPPVNDED